ncbi:MAG: rubredoxin-like domain-containing protein, partial [Christensenellales bacterium]
MKKFVCSVCGYVAEGKIPEECPVCHAKADKFVAMQEGKREWADQHVIGVAKDV